MIVLSMYLASFALRVLIMVKGHFLCHDQSNSDECIYFTQTGEKLVPSYSAKVLWEKYLHTFWNVITNNNCMFLNIQLCYLKINDIIVHSYVKKCELYSYSPCMSH